MTFYQELQLNQAGSKALIKASKSKKEKHRHIAVYLFKILLTVAFCTAYEQCAYYADQMVAYLEENRNLVEETLKDVDGIDVIHAEGTYLLWLDCRKLNMSQEELDRFFVETVKLGLNSGKSFGPEGNGFLRMNIACPRSTVKEAMNRIVTSVKAL